MPNGIKPPALSAAAWRETFRSPALMLCVLVTVLFSAGQFVLFSYFAPYYKQTLGITPAELSILFLWFGAFGFIGNVLHGRECLGEQLPGRAPGLILAVRTYPIIAA